MDPQAVIEIFRRNVTEHYLDFQGRVRRQEFWYYILAYVVLYIIAAILQSIVGFHLLTALLSLGLLLPSLGIGVRRLHDTGRSGWWILMAAVPGVLMIILTTLALLSGAYGTMVLTAMVLPLISLVAAVVLIIWYAQPGVAGANEYGPDPKAAA